MNVITRTQKKRRNDHRAYNYRFLVLNDQEEEIRKNGTLWTSHILEGEERSNGHENKEIL